MEYFDLNGCILALTDSRNIVGIHRFINQLNLWCIHLDGLSFFQGQLL